MTKQLKSKFQNLYTNPYEISKLTHMGLHMDNRWQRRDLPAIQKQGLWYPLSIYKVTPEWWKKSFMRWCPKACQYDDPVINEDGLIWAIKNGNNRYQCAKYLGYDTIDGIIFPDANLADEFTEWCKNFDPLNNEDAPVFDILDGLKHAL